MFPNLEAEMARGKITQSSIALSLGITPTTFSFKLNGKAPISLLSDGWTRHQIVTRNRKKSPVVAGFSLAYRAA